MGYAGAGGTATLDCLGTGTVNFVLALSAFCISCGESRTLRMVMLDEHRIWGMRIYTLNLGQIMRKWNNTVHLKMFQVANVIFPIHAIGF